ncbi:PDZ and LIM domain protein Zasp-like isoform X8 [Toxorhynchites rutilus septentrionalis]|uniref:PDZ and LIM domain protein Zasp-like isoform X8 n=1 Tax=Toxorhynchites rutilus septentrionalis TaxID=329112 RepID=UPI00247AEC96|nr:PDZ and LIM domain protein Zasp-like isoform X8 [Toxorhynchites rutilus septentrionalis]
MANLITVRLQRGEGQSWGFRLQGGKDFSSPLVLQRVNGGSVADQAGLQPGDALIKVNNTEVFNLRHKEAQDVILAAGNSFELAVSRGTAWRPSVTPTGSLPSPSPSLPGHITPVTKTSLAATPQPVQHIGSGHNQAAKPFAAEVNGSDGQVKSIVNKQYNTPVAMYSDETIAETLSSQAEVLAGGVLGVNFKKNERVYSPANSEVYKLLHEQGNEPEPVDPPKASLSAHQQQQQQVQQHHQQQQQQQSHTNVVTRHVSAPVDKPPSATNGIPAGQNICDACDRLIVGVFVRIKDKNLHADCFKCATCGTSLKNQGYFNLNNKLYCDIHARLAALQSPPPGTNGMVPVTITKPGQKSGVQAISAALNAHANLNGRSQPLQSTTLTAALPATITINGCGGSNTQSPSHSRSSSTTSSSGYCNSSSLSPVQSNKVSPLHSRTSSENELILEPPSSNRAFTVQCDFNFPPPPPPLPPALSARAKMEHLEAAELQQPAATFGANGLAEAPTENSTDSTDKGSVTQNEYGFFYRTMGGAVVRSVFPPGGSSRYKNQNNITPKPFGAPQPVNVPASYPPVAGSVPTPFSAAIASQPQAPAPVSAPAPVAASYPPMTAPAPVAAAPIVPAAVAPAQQAGNGNAIDTKPDDENERNEEEEQDFGHEVPSQMEDMPVPSGRISMTDALATAPERPYTPFREVKFERSEMYQELLHEQPSIQVDPEANFSAFASVGGNRTPVPFKPIVPEIREEPCEQQKSEPEPEPEPEPVEEKKQEEMLKPTEKLPPYPRKDAGSEHYSLAPKRESNSPLHHPAEIPTYQRKWYNLPTQNPPHTPEPEELRQNVPLAFVDTHSKPHLKKPIAHAANGTEPVMLRKKAFTTIQNRTVPVVQTAIEDDAELAHFNNAHSRLQSKGVIDRGQAFTPSLILTKHPTTIPYYQHQLGFEEYFAESKEFDGRRTPNAVRKSPAFGPPPNPLKSYVPPSREGIPNESGLYLSMGKLQGVPWYANMDHIPLDIQQKMQEQHHGLGKGHDFTRQHRSVSYQDKPVTVHTEMHGATTVQTRSKESAMREQASAESTTSSAKQVGNALIQKRTKVVEEHEHTQAAKTIEIAKFSSKIKDEEAPLKGYVAQQTRRFSGQDDSLNVPQQLQQQQQQQPPPTVPEQYEPQPQDVKPFPQNSAPPVFSTFPSANPFAEPIVDRFPAKSARKASVLVSSTQLPRSPNPSSNFKAQFNEFMVGSGSNPSLPARKEEDKRKELTQSSRPSQPPSITSNSNPNVGAQPPLKQPLISVPEQAAPAVPNGHRASINGTNGLSSNSSNRSSRKHSSDRSGASAGSAAMNKGRAACSTTAPTRGRGVMNKAVGPGGRVPLCGCCNQQIRGPFITALGRIWCPDHFICHNGNCKRPLADIGFVEEKGDLYCEYCFEEFLAPVCSKCNTRVKGDCLNAIGKQFHPECFKCTYCGKLFGNSPFFLEEGDPYCEADWNELFTTKCFACGFPVEAGDKWVEALNNNYHSQCFNCTSCKKNLEGQSFFAKGGRPFCKNHAR